MLTCVKVGGCRLGGRQLRGLQKIDRGQLRGAGLVLVHLVNLTKLKKGGEGVRL